MVRALRSDSATAAILADLPGTPVLTVQTARRIHDVSHVAASRGLEELREAGILDPKTIGPGRHAYVCNDVLDTITWAERRLPAPSSTPAPAHPDPVDQRHFRRGTHD